MIKGRQVNLTKRGEIQLVLHRQLPDKPKTATQLEWMKWFSSQDKSYKIEKPAPWWEHVWPRIKDQVNIALAKEQEEYVDEAARVWVRIGDDISISIYSMDVKNHRDYKLGPFHPGCMTDHVRMPIDWWNNTIDDVTDQILMMVKA